ncbi:hypothetical protein D9V32_01515 [Mycetocola tolaasinivorans]|uniref:Alcohol dehydrogenase n=1 Tax=Mycetocola tolaasinivorans TaxID=76635 RepID=A0A3L7ACE9_9MICO|nr:alcohol dehydrogenase catalytic domain-containing protein [Mycetocola tolaasinivorans]RLP78033.1 hypothetical protein D9V32_01515 [Mycetocola tolaasinivorans]
MRALRIPAPGTLHLAEVPEPVAGPGEEIYRPHLVGLCGTDLDLIDGLVDPAFVRYPLTLGHEWVGRDSAGRTVVTEGLIPCGSCVRCEEGRENLCATYAELGFTRDGAAAATLAVPRHLAHEIAAGVDPTAAVIAEPASVVYRALERAIPTPGARILIIGDGTIGLLAAALARVWEPERVDLRGLRTEQATLAEHAGVDRFLTRRAAKGYDLVVEASGSPAGVAAALAATRRGGTLALLGYLGRDVRFPLDVDALINADLTVLGSFASTSASWRSVVELINAGTLDAGWLVTHRFALTDYVAAVDALRHPHGARGKIVLELPQN